MSPADSAGRPFAGRSFAASTSAFGGDDGAAPAAYTVARDAFRRGDAGLEAVVDALRGVRLLVPLLAEAGGTEVDAAGGIHEKTQELSLVTVAAPDGRRVLPAFSSMTAMTAWNPAARPIPAPAPQVALGAAGDGTELVVIDAATERVGLRRSALEALARATPWRPPWTDERVVAELRAAAGDEPLVVGVRVGTDDPRASLDGAEVLVELVLVPDADPGLVRELLARVQRRWTGAPSVRDRVDSLRVRLASG